MVYRLKKLKDNFYLVNDLEYFPICEKLKKLKSFMLDLIDMIKNNILLKEKS